MALRRRRLGALVVSAAVPAALVIGGGHRGVHAARSLLLPGAGVFGEAWVLGLAFLTLALVATVLWARWGADWTVLVVVAGSAAASAAIAPTAHAAATEAIRFDRSAHEFPLVMLVIAAWQWARRLPLVNRVHRRHRAELDGLADLGALGAVDRCRAVSVLALAGPGGPAARAAIAEPDVERRARRVALLARGRHGAGALDRDQAALRTARYLAGPADTDERHRFELDAGRQTTGVPASEPGWVRLLDATLAAAALDPTALDPTALDPASGATHRWVGMLHGPFALHRGHRPAMYWTPLGITLGHADPWEHATATAIGRSFGWVGDDDWPAIRQRVLGASARGSRHPRDERLIAAGRLWLAFVDDPEAERLLARPTVRRDPLACAIDQLAAHHRSPHRTREAVPV